MSEEQWRPVLGYEGIYEVSDHGRVRSLDRWISTGHSPFLRAGCVLAQHWTSYANSPRLVVSLHGRGKPRKRLVHQLVLEAFTGPRPPGLHACHNNGVPSDNSAANLRWDTASENMYDRVRHGTHNHAIKTHCKRGHALTADNVRRRPPGSRPKRDCLACQKVRNAQRSTKKAADV